MPGRINTTALTVCAIGLFVLTIVSVPLSVAVGVSSLEVPPGYKFPGKEVGYLSAFNWLANFGIVLPALTMCLVALLKSIDQTNRQLVENKMAFDVEARAYVSDANKVLSAWLETLRMVRVVWWLFAAIAVVYSYWECWDNSIQPILAGKVDGKETDWAVGALLYPERVSATANIGFSIFVWTIQGLAVSLALLLLPLSWGYGAFLWKHSYKDEGAQFIFVVSSNSPDKRRGFEHFEDSGTLIIGSALVSCVAMYLTILRNEYLRMPGTTIWDMPAGPFAFFVSLNNESTLLMLMLGLVVVITVVFAVPCIALSWAADRARKNYLDVHGTHGSAHTDPMQWWPYRWIKLNVLLTGLAFCVIALFVPSLAPYVLFVYATVLVAFIVSRIRKAFGNNAASPNTP